MLPTQHISVSTQRFGVVRHTVNQVITWGFLVGAEGLSRWWFGGSWLVDLMVLLCMIAIVVQLMKNTVGHSVRMSGEELQAWVVAGMPGNVAEWRASEKSRVVGGGRL